MTAEPTAPALSRLQRWLLVSALLLPLLLLSAAALLLMRAVQDEALVVLPQAVRSDDVGHVVDLLRVHDPRKVPPGQQRRLRLEERDLDVLASHVVVRRLGVPMRVHLTPQHALVEASLRLPPNVLGGWLNVQATWRQGTPMPELQALRVGHLSLPPMVGTWLLGLAVRHAGLQDQLQLAGEVLKGLRLGDRTLELDYVLGRDSAARLVAGLIPPAEQARLRAYTTALAKLSHAQPADKAKVSLAIWLPPLFTLAQQRSLQGEDAAAENRALLLVLTLYANGKRLDRVLPAARQWPQPRPVTLTLNGRHDTPLHWLVSAALVTEGSGALSKAVGLYKEVADSRGGSGFSFNDLAADRAGTRVGERALRDPRALQDRLAATSSEADLMPAATDLPESMSEPEFLRRYGGVGAPAYAALLAEIDRRVAALPALR